MSYAGNWHGSGQIPARAVDAGVDLAVRLDRSRRGGQHRAPPAGCAGTACDRPRRASCGRWRTSATYRFNLFSNFTLYLRDPDNGDEIEQVDRRIFYGAKVSYRVLHHRRAGVTFDTTIGADGRSDDIHEELWNTLARRQPDRPVRDNDVHETLPGRVLQRGDHARRAGYARTWAGAPICCRSPSTTASPTADPSRTRRRRRGGAPAQPQGEPDRDAARAPGRGQLDVYLNYGHGFHSNDVRGVFAQPAVTPLARADGRGDRRARAPVRPLGSGGGAVAARSRQRDGVERRRRHDRGRRRRPPASGVELETRYEVTPLAGGRPGR